LSHLHLGLVQFLANGNEFFAIHGYRLVLFSRDKKTVDIAYHNVVGNVNKKFSTLDRIIL
jgi:hypothetical protein